MRDSLCLICFSTFSSAREKSKKVAVLNPSFSSLDLNIKRGFEGLAKAPLQFTMLIFLLSMLLFISFASYPCDISTVLLLTLMLLVANFANTK